ncbi:MAG: acetyl-CoA decarbonylase/synthase complex subunit gamma [Deltaproteobacteria bacterium]|nr:MAG: acetyl-CoA decarbonylase/synthase complex subunit gamma [Deltaproteobacteria bacterium]HEX16748.1 acetyl-CoA decarbonylase/synthase complex subunit gamma [Deltaproteobacteria bacterium]
MAVKGGDIAKLLPKRTKCKECGFPTCFAFAMKVASGGVDIDKCPYLDEETKEKIREMLAPPILPVTLGKGERAFVIGDEEVMFRHEKTFFHQPGIGILVRDTEPEAEWERKLRAVLETSYERIGRTIRPDLAALWCESGDEGKFLSLVKKASEVSSDLPLVLMAPVEMGVKAVEVCGADRRPLIYAVTKEDVDQHLPKLKELGVPVAVKGALEELAEVTQKLKEAGLKEVVLDTGSRGLWEAVKEQILLRRAALKQGFRPLGYPTITFPCFMAEDLQGQYMMAGAFIARYAGIIVLSDFVDDYLYPLLTMRMNIYSDPRVPMTVEAKLYEINAPSPESPVLVTTNFALTYFAVAAETEGTKIPAYLVVQDTEGLCVLAAWSTGKFNGETIGEFVKKLGLEDKVKSRKIVIPGLLARIKGELEDELPGWEVIVGPREATGLASFLPELVGGR